MLLALVLASSCEVVLSNVAAAVQSASLAAEAEQCEDLTGDRETGKLDGTAVTALTSGPNGSGRYWTIALSFGRTRACLATTTIGFRNVAATGVFPAMKLFSVPNRLTVWTSIGSTPPTEEGSPPTQLLLPLVHRLARGKLVVDAEETRKQIRVFADLYARAAEKKTQFEGLHRAAAVAYRAYADGKRCP